MISIYNYSNPVSYLKDYFSFLKNTNPRFSLTTWASEAGLQSPNLMIDILKEKKELKVPFAASVIDRIGLDATEHTYFLALTSKLKASDEKIGTMFDLLLSDLRPTTKHHFTEKRLKDGGLFTHWILTTILGISRLEHVELDPKSIKAILREEISEEIIDIGISYLVENHFLKSVNGRLERVYDQTSTVTDKKHPNVKEYFSQMADMAKRSVDLDVTERELHSFSLPLAYDKLPVAKEIIRKCRAQLATLSEGRVDEVYQMNMFLFPLTDRKEKETRPQ